MTNYRKILRLHSLGYSQRSIASSVKVSRNKVSEVLKKIKEFHIPLCRRIIVNILDTMITVLSAKTNKPPHNRQN